jgi:DNA mismatch repair protein PMS2
MVGDVLKFAKMRKLVDNLVDMRKPWICAHGRPTMRYLLNIDEYRKKYMYADFKYRR